METLAELKAMLKRLQDKWDSGSVGNPHEIVKLDMHMKELKKRIQALEN